MREGRGKRAAVGMEGLRDLDYWLSHEIGEVAELLDETRHPNEQMIG